LPYSGFGWRLFEVRKLNLKKQKKEVDRGLLFLTLILTVVGLVAVADASAPQAVNVFGDKFYFDGAGNLITKLNPKRICVHALSALSGPIYVANELFYAGIDPNEMRLNRVGCFDVGVRCGGWGRIALEVKIEDRK